MNNEHMSENEVTCVSRCDEEFIECVEHLNSRCAEAFNECASTCKID